MSQNSHESNPICTCFSPTQFFDRIALKSSESKATPKTFDDFISDQIEISNTSNCDDPSSSSSSGMLLESECQEDEFRPLFLKVCFCLMILLLPADLTMFHQYAIHLTVIILVVIYRVFET